MLDWINLYPAQDTTHTLSQAIQAAIAAAGVRRAKFVQQTAPVVVHPKRKKHLVEKERDVKPYL
jgi:hypothetical protein